MGNPFVIFASIISTIEYSLRTLPENDTIVWIRRLRDVWNYVIAAGGDDIEWFSHLYLKMPFMLPLQEK